MGLLLALVGALFPLVVAWLVIVSIVWPLLNDAFQRSGDTDEAE